MFQCFAAEPSLAAATPRPWRPERNLFIGLDIKCLISGISLFVAQAVSNVGNTFAEFMCYVSV